MARGKPWQLQTLPAQPVSLGDLRLIPEAQALTVRWPRGGFVWNRPLAVVVEQGDHRERISIPNVTLLVRIALLGVTLALTVAGLLLNRKKESAS